MYGGGGAVDECTDVTDQSRVAELTAGSSLHSFRAKYGEEINSQKIVCCPTADFVKLLKDFKDITSGRYTDKQHKQRAIKGVERGKRFIERRDI